jgi:hypothetical protein
MSRRVLMVLTVAAVVALMVVSAVPAAAQTGGGEVAFAQQKEKGKGKGKGKQKQMPESGGFSGQQVALMGLGAGALLVGGGILVGVRRSTR